MTTLLFHYHMFYVVAREVEYNLLYFICHTVNSVNLYIKRVTIETCYYIVCSPALSHCQRESDDIRTTLG